ncbi:hypothetical protein P4S64_20120 [Vibrio sp. M60_M31a]
MDSLVQHLDVVIFSSGVRMVSIDEHSPGMLMIAQYFIAMTEVRV